MKTREITLEEILDQREKRMYAIEETQDKYPNHSIISYKLNIPGPLKNNELFLYAFEEGLKQIKGAKMIVDWREKLTGAEAILIYDKAVQETKLDMIEIEDHFPLGRLFDLDVLGSDRKALNISPRRCLICDDPAHVCSRSRKHALDEVLEKINQIILDYKNSTNN